LMAVAGGEREVLAQVFLLSNKARNAAFDARFHDATQTNTMVSW
jgi:hypothetical protein